MEGGLRVPVDVDASCLAPVVAPGSGCHPGLHRRRCTHCFPHPCCVCLSCLYSPYDVPYFMAKVWVYVLCLWRMPAPGTSSGDHLVVASPSTRRPCAGAARPEAVGCGAWEGVGVWCCCLRGRTCWRCWTRSSCACLRPALMRTCPIVVVDVVERAPDEVGGDCSGSSASGCTAFCGTPWSPFPGRAPRGCYMGMLWWVLGGLLRGAMHCESVLGFPGAGVEKPAGLFYSQGANKLTYSHPANKWVSQRGFSSRVWTAL